MPLGANKVALYGASADTGTAVLLSTATASSSASLSFTLPTAYKQVKFGFYNITPATDTVLFEFNASTDGGSNYNVTKTTTFFYAYHWESDAHSGLGYITGSDIAQGTGYQTLMRDVANDADACGTGELTLYNPASTTYVKQFCSRTATYETRDTIEDSYIAGYLNTTSAVNAVDFKMSSGNIATGTIKMWGIK